MIHLDTNFIVRALVPGTPEDVRLQTWLRGRERLGVSAAAWAEFLCGPVTPPQVAFAASVLGEPLPLDRATVEVAAAVFNASGRRRGTMVDCFVAASAMRAGAALATENVSDFRRMVAAGLVLA